MIVYVGINETYMWKGGRGVHHQNKTKNQLKWWLFRDIRTTQIIFKILRVCLSVKEANDNERRRRRSK